MARALRHPRCRITLHRCVRPSKAYVTPSPLAPGSPATHNYIVKCTYYRFNFLIIYPSSYTDSQRTSQPASQPTSQPAKQTARTSQPSSKQLASLQPAANSQQSCQHTGTWVFLFSSIFFNYEYFVLKAEFINLY